MSIRAKPVHSSFGYGFAALCLLVVALLLPPLALAHQPGLSSLAVQMRPTEVAVHLTLARKDVEKLYPLDTDASGSISTNEFEAARLALEEIGARAIQISVGTNVLASSAPSVRMDDSDAIHFEFGCESPGTNAAKLRSLILQMLPSEHRQSFTIHDERGNLLAAWLLEGKNDSVQLPIAGVDSHAETPSSFAEFFRLGVEHIVAGYDHLVFLFGLLIVGGRFVAAVKIITAFTVAHSLTLALATLNLVRLSPQIVEPLIAASIIYVGLENIYRRDLEKRWALTFAFGLIHGLGFAGVLREIGVGQTIGVVQPLLAFNLGVESGQLAIAALALPVIWAFKDWPQYQRRYVPALSVLVAVAGGYWLFERLAGMWK